MSRLLSDATEHRRNVIEDVIWLTDCGEAPEQVARSLGYANARNLARCLEKWDEPSLARRILAPRLGVWAA